SDEEEKVRFYLEQAEIHYRLGDPEAAERAIYLAKMIAAENSDPELFEEIEEFEKELLEHHHHHH
uniref:IL-1Rmb80 n=1 Tax=synthetic construct TaxID=32630 RepID=UPI00355C9EE2